MGLHFKQLLSSGLRLVVRHGSEKKKEVAKKRKTSHHTHRWRPDPTQMSKGGVRQPQHLRRSSAVWLCRWFYEQRDDGKPITNVSVSSYFQGQNHLCADSSCAPPFVQVPLLLIAGMEQKSNNRSTTDTKITKLLAEMMSFESGRAEICSHALNEREFQ